MVAKKRSLGRGLDALLGSPKASTKPATRAVSAVSTGAREANISQQIDGEMRTLGVERLQRGQYQPRVDMHADSLEDLADSIRAQGIVQPIVVRPIMDGEYEIIAGERRWRAAQLAGLREVPVVIRDMDDRAAIAVSLIENIQRENLNPLEEARALERLIREFEMTHQQAAEAVGRSRAAVSNLLRLLELGEVATAMVQRGELEMGHARALLALAADQQVEAAHQVVKKGLTVRATERLVKQLLVDGRRPKETTAARRDPNLVSLEQDLSDKIGAPVQVQQGGRGRGKLVISYTSLDELDGILEHIQ
ncbi:Chromosome (plasmid) partitioning protein ParB [hydrothermal vent metagenome]|uniref:Chromosome (Plasmid) partitioning protein ParB n=1 Tax=hydrothermal vent metagenome TaxID=652676 RepID=A0A3B0YJ28_9ZZZZ